MLKFNVDRESNKLFGISAKQFGKALRVLIKFCLQLSFNLMKGTSGAIPVCIFSLALQVEPLSLGQLTFNRHVQCIRLPVWTDIAVHTRILCEKSVPGLPGGGFRLYRCLVLIH